MKAPGTVERLRKPSDCSTRSGVLNAPHPGNRRQEQGDYMPALGIRRHLCGSECLDHEKRQRLKKLFIHLFFILIVFSVHCAHVCGYPQQAGLQSHVVVGTMNCGCWK